MILILASVAWLAGIIAGHYVVAPIELAVAGALAAVAIGLLWWRTTYVRSILLAFAVLLVALARTQALVPSLAHPPLAAFNDRNPVAVRGVIADNPTPRGASTELRVAVDELAIAGEPGWQAMSGGVLVRVPNEPTWRYGDYVELRGTLDTPPDFDGFAYRDHLARQGIAALMRYPKMALLAEDQTAAPLAVVNELGGALSRALARSLPEPQAALAQGILLGRRSAIPPDLVESFATTNTTHVIAISGTNITLVVGVLLFAGRRFFGRRSGLIVALAGIASYALLVGLSPTVVRAAIMGGVFTVGYHFGRPRDATAGLALAAALMTAVDPGVVFDLGFQLSFLATAGLVFLASPIERRLAPLPSPLRALLAITFAAELATLPIILLSTGRLSLVGPLANLIVPPLLPPVMLSSAITACATALWPPLGQVFGAIAWLFLSAMVWAVETLGALPGATVPLGQPAMSFIVLYYAVGALLVMHHLAATTPLQRGWQRFWAAVPAAPCLGALSLTVVLAWSLVLTLPESSLRITVLDVGQGDALLLRTAEHKILVDGGPDPVALANALGRRLPFWDRRIDLVVLSHPDEDHIAGLIAVLERFEVVQVLDNGAASGGASYRRWLELIAARGIKRTIAIAGERIDLGDGAIIRVLNPLDSPTALASNADDNERSVVLKLSAGGFGILLGADIGPKAASGMISAGLDLRATVLKVPHHGSRDGVSEALLTATKPELAIISVGRGNRFGHPAPETLRLLEKRGVTVYRTDLNGTVDITLEGHDAFRVQTQR